MVAIQIWCAVFAFTCVVQYTNAGAVAFGGTCVVLTDTCTTTQATCRAETTGGALTCNCDSTKYMVKSTGSDACVCMTGYSGTVPACKGNVGSTCALTADCLTNGYCGSDKKCACSPTHTGASGATTCAAIAIAGTCTATGGECSAIANSYCNTGVTLPVCTCSTIFPLTGATCTAKDCTSGATACTSVDANSVCTANACACKSNYGIFSPGTKATCQPGVGATCTASGGECANLPGGYCNTAVTPTVCACGVVYTAGTGATAATCLTKPCEQGSTTCSALDANSECGKGYCVCKSGTMGSVGKCTASGALKVVTSMLLLAANLMAAILM